MRSMGNRLLQSMYPDCADPMKRIDDPIYQQPAPLSLQPDDQHRHP
jgi:hypothetical protein